MKYVIKINKDKIIDRIWLWQELIHREIGPAYENNMGYKAWWKEGNRHRIDGPAIIYPNRTAEYWTEGFL